MKRDPELVRTLLLAVEEWTPKENFDDVLRRFGLNPSESEDLDCSIRYHAHILIGAGYMEARVARLEMGDLCEYGNFALPSLTWAGQEFLQAARDESIWNQAKQKAGGIFNSLTMDVLLLLLKQTMKDRLGLDL